MRTRVESQGEVLTIVRIPKRREKTRVKGGVRTKHLRVRNKHLESKFE
jgi:hypothetical protein